MESASPSAYVSASLSLSLSLIIKKIFKIEHPETAFELYINMKLCFLYIEVTWNQKVLAIILAKRNTRGKAVILVGKILPYYLSIQFWPYSSSLWMLKLKWWVHWLS